MGALLEHAALVQLFHELELPLERPPRIVNISIDYLRPLPARRHVSPAASSSARGAASPTCGVEAWQSNRDKLVAAAHAHFLLPGE